MLPDDRTREEITFLRPQDDSYIVLRNGKETKMTWPLPRGVQPGETLIMVGRNGVLVGIERLGLRLV